jgi:hypothetical protein
MKLITDCCYDCVLFMLRIKNKPIMLSVFMLSNIILEVVAPDAMPIPVNGFFGHFINAFANDLECGQANSSCLC